MNKKFIRVLSFMLSVMMLFACVITASADEATTVQQVNVVIKVEGLSKNLTEKNIKVDKLSTVKAAIDAAGIDVVYAEDGITIKSVKGEGEIKTSKWQYAVDKVIQTAKINAYVLDKDAEIILYNATEDAVIPSFDATDVATGGIVVFTGTDKAGNKSVISGATVKWQSSKGLTGLLSPEFTEYTTDSKGRIIISDVEELYEGKHAVEIMKTNAYDVPEVVRVGTIEVEVPKLDSTEVQNKTLFEEIYDMLYSILKGVLEVWSFYINAIIGLFGGEPLFGAVTTTPIA